MSNSSKILRSKVVYDNISTILESIENNLQYLCHAYFINLTTFDFLGDSIVEAANNGIKMTVRGVLPIN